MIPLAVGRPVWFHCSLMAFLRYCNLERIGCYAGLEAMDHHGFSPKTVYVSTNFQGPTRFPIHTVRAHPLKWGLNFFRGCCNGSSSAYRQWTVLFLCPAIGPLGPEQKCASIRACGAGSHQDPGRPRITGVWRFGALSVTVGTSMSRNNVREHSL